MSIMKKILLYSLLLMLTGCGEGSQKYSQAELEDVSRASQFLFEQLKQGTIKNDWTGRPSELAALLEDTPGQASALSTNKKWRSIFFVADDVIFWEQYPGFQFIEGVAAINGQVTLTNTYPRTLSRGYDPGTLLFKQLEEGVYHYSAGL